jgi:hypothetical protein
MSVSGSVRRLALALGAVAAVGAVGCGTEMDDSEVVQSAITTENALTMNALTMNALSMNALSMNALSMNALSMNALSMNALTMNALRDPLSRELLTYIVSCALEDGDHLSVRIDGKRYSFDGSLGLAPEWGGEHGWCDGECQRWVSACVLARVDAAGVKRQISIRGDHPALRSTQGELRQYTDREGAYFGNLFVRDKPRFLCLSPGKTSDKRVCGDSLDDCPMTVVGSCDDACADEGRYRDFEDCSDRGRAERGHVYHEAITVFLPTK